MSEEKHDDRIGALWSKQSRNGAPFMTGSIKIDGEEVSIVCFRRRSREKDDPKKRYPDWKILRSRPKPETTEATDDEVPF